MNSENQEAIYCADDDENSVYCGVCDELCIEKYYKNHLKSGTHLNNIYKRKQYFSLKSRYISNVTDDYNDTLTTNITNGYNDTL